MSYCPQLNPIERLWAVLHQYVTYNRYYASKKQFADAIHAFMRETIPQKWKTCPRQDLKQLPRHKPRELSGFRTAAI
ncbi:MAG: transposase [Gammaproteobacteria bacterium]|jgi:transposase